MSNLPVQAGSSPWRPRALKRQRQPHPHPTGPTIQPLAQAPTHTEPALGKCPPLDEKGCRPGWPCPELVIMGPQWQKQTWARGQPQAPRGSQAPQMWLARQGTCDDSK